MNKLFSGILAYVFKNLSVAIGVIEAVLKAFAAIVSLTPTKKDDKIYAMVDKAFSYLKKFLYTLSDKLANKPVNIPN